MFYILLAIYHALFAILAWRRLNWTVLFIIAALPTYLIRFQIGLVPFTLLEGMILIVFVVWLIHYKNPKIPKHKNTKLLIPLGLFLLAATIGMFIAPELRAAAGIWKAYFIEPILFFIVLIHLKISKEKIITALGVSILIPGIFAIFQKFTGAFILNPLWAAEETRRVTSLYGYPNAIGLYFAPIAILALTQLIANRKTLLAAGFWLLVAVISFCSIVFAVSKGALLAIFIALIFLAIFWKGYRLLFTGIVIAALIIGLFTPQLRSLKGTPTIEGGGSLEIRTEQWGETWEMLKTRPILGAGLSGYQEIVKPFHKKDYIEIFQYPHNVILNFWVEIGLLGLIAFVWLVIVFFKKRPAIGISAAMIVLLIHGLVDVPYFKNDLAVLFWVLYALGLSWRGGRAVEGPVLEKL